ncbi:MAG: hypothetical protein LUC91_08170, partial [Prevotella sp.]|nr:hypothetical protein [Prevotella sp.]
MKTVKSFMFMALAIALPLVFTSCSDDDDDDNGGGSSSSSGVSIITTDDGDQLLLKKVGSYLNFSYDNQGRCTNIVVENNLDYDISYGPCVISDGDCWTANVTLNNAGYMTKFDGSYYDKDGQYYEDGTYVMNCSYDSNGHLTKITITSDATEKDSYGTSNYSSSATATLTWKNGNLTKVEYNSSDNEDGDKSTSTYTYTYSYGSKANKYQQCTTAFIEPFDIEDGFESLGYIGFLGKWSSDLPSSVDVVEDYESSYYSGHYSTTDTYSFTLNSDGTIQKETGDWYSLSYTYSTFSSSSRSAELSPWSEENTYNDEYSYTKRISKHRKHMHHAKYNKGN